MKIEHSTPPSRSTLVGIWRGMRRRCPACGKGALFVGYIQVQPICAQCGHANGRYRVDDAPAWLTILLVGHLFLPPLFLCNFIFTWPILSVMAFCIALLLCATAFTLPIAKGFFLGMEWARSPD